jgi:hypothetical protein
MCDDSSIRKRRFLMVLACVAAGLSASPADAQQSPWRAGVAKAVITPKESLWMAGYAARNKPSEGTAQDLYAKALALQDETGKQLVIVTMDLIGIPRNLRDAVAKDVLDQHKLPPAALLLNASHTHCGPVVRSGGSVLYDVGPEMSQRIERYVAELKKTLVTLVGQALSDLQPAKLGYSRARAGFAMNRRLPTAKEPINSPYPDGPVEHEVPVLRIDDADGKPRAVLFGYACHNTTLSFYQFCGDYAGYAQECLEKDRPGLTALFMTGCGGDQNPYPRGTLEQAKQHGRSLANGVEAALLPKPRPVRGPLRSALEEVTLDFIPPGREELLKLKESKAKNEQRRAELLLAELDKAGQIHAKYQYPIQIVRFGDDLTLIALAGEVVVDYVHRLKRELKGSTLWVAGYSNDVFGYVPSLRVLKEGGYEGGGAMRLTRLPGPFAPSVEERIIGKVHEMLSEGESEAGKTATPAKLTLALLCGGDEQDLNVFRATLQKVPGIKFEANEIRFADFGREGGKFTSFFAIELADRAKTDIGAVAKAVAAANTSKKEQTPPALYAVIRYRPDSTNNEKFRAALAKVKGVRPDKSWAGDQNLWVSVDGSGEGKLAEITRALHEARIPIRDPILDTDQP